VVNAVLLDGHAATAYEVMVGITSPANVDPRWCAWLLSVCGRGAMPAFVGAMAGYLVTAQIQTHQAEPLEEVVRRLRELDEVEPGISRVRSTGAPQYSGALA
jgi:hypothetical protein